MALDFKRRHFQLEVILMLIRCYIAYALSYRDVQELAAERGDVSTLAWTVNSNSHVTFHTQPGADSHWLNANAADYKRPRYILFKNALFSLLFGWKCPVVNQFRFQ
jgi:hypothetical protein